MIGKMHLKTAVSSGGRQYLYLDKRVLKNNRMCLLEISRKIRDFHVNEHADLLVHVFEGRCAIEFENHKLYLREGDITLIPKGTLHRAVCKTVAKCVVAEINVVSDQVKMRNIALALIDHRTQTAELPAQYLGLEVDLRQ